MILLIDNYDSFTYNIYQLLRRMDAAVVVRRNDEITLGEVEAMAPRRIILSPGPGGPEQGGICVSLVQRFAGRIPILGICLGHQCIAAAFGGKIVQASRICHGLIDRIHHDRRGVFRGLAEPAVQTRYHSLGVERKSLPEVLEVTAESGDGEIMGLRHRFLPVEGVQFHPESVASSQGDLILANFLGDRGAGVMKHALETLMEGKSLAEEEAEEVMETLASGDAPAAQIGALLCLLRAKGESVEEITGFARVMRRKAVRLKAPQGACLVDTCGTGGDQSGTFNISTAAALVAAGAGLVVAKHGNRSVTSRCGSADVLETLGVPLDGSPGMTEKNLAKGGFAFLFAPNLHPAMKNAVPVRRALGLRTVFNLLGPMTNPAGARVQVMGVFAPEWTEPAARVLGRLGVERALVVHGSDGLDEITLTGPTRISELKDGWVRTYEFHPREAGLSCCSPEELKGGDGEENARIIRRILAGEPGPQRDITLLNAGAVIYAASGEDSIAGGVDRARRSIDSGAAAAVLDRLVSGRDRE